CTLLSRYHAGAIDQPGSAAAESETFDPAQLPLEVLVEREHVPRGTTATPRLAADTGVNFLQRLDAAGLGRYRAAFVGAYPFPAPLPADRDQLDPDSLRYLEVMAGRVPHGGALYAAVRQAGAVLPAVPPVAAADTEAMLQTVTAWSVWVYGLFSDRPADADV